MQSRSITTIERGLGMPLVRSGFYRRRCQPPNTVLQALAASTLPHPIGPAPPHRQHLTLQQNDTSWPPLPIKSSPAQARAQALIIQPDIVWMAPNATQLAELLQHRRIRPKGLPRTRTIREAVHKSHTDDCYLHTTRDRFTAMKCAYGHKGDGSGTFIMLDLTAIQTDPLLSGHRWTCQGPTQPLNTTLLPPGTATDKLRMSLRRSTTITEELVREHLTPLHVIQVDGNFHQPTPIIHDLSTNQGSTDRLFQIKDGWNSRQSTARFVLQ